MLNKKDIQSVNTQSPKKKETALHYASRNNQLNCVKFLIEHGADPNIKGLFLIS